MIVLHILDQMQLQASGRWWRPLAPATGQYCTLFYFVHVGDSNSFGFTAYCVQLCWHCAGLVVHGRQCLTMHASLNAWRTWPQKLALTKPWPAQQSTAQAGLPYSQVFPLLDCVCVKFYSRV